MKEKDLHEGCIEQINRLFRERLYIKDEIPLDTKGRIRIDDWEMREDVQNEITKLWKLADTSTLPEIGDLNGYKSDFLNLFGFGFDGVDYNEDVNENIDINGLV